MMKYRVCVVSIALIAIFIIGLIGCEQDNSRLLTIASEGLNFFQAGDPDDVDSDECKKGYGVHLIQGDKEKGKSGQITLLLPVGHYTILYDTEGSAGNSKDVVVTSRKNWRVFIGTLAEHNKIVNVLILNQDTGEMITAVLNGVIQEGEVCALDDKYGQLLQPEPEPQPVTEVFGGSSAEAPASKVFLP